MTNTRNLYNKPKNILLNVESGLQPRCMTTWMYGCSAFTYLTGQWAFSLLSLRIKFIVWIAIILINGRLMMPLWPGLHRARHSWWQSTHPFTTVYGCGHYMFTCCPHQTNHWCMSLSSEYFHGLGTHRSGCTNTITSLNTLYSLKTYVMMLPSKIRLITLSAFRI